MITIISYPLNSINVSIADPDSLDSNELVKYATVNVEDALTDEYIEVTYNGETITLLITDECRFTPFDVHFINKEGAQQIFTMFKKRTDSISITSEEFESDRGQPLLGNHQFVKFNSQAKRSFKLNTGFVKEVINETIQQILLSNRVWIYENNVLTPVNVKSKSLDYKTRQNDRLINYEVSFDYAFNEVNNI